jgi:hypothetical protein
MLIWIMTKPGAWTEDGELTAADSEPDSSESVISDQ